MMRYWLIRRVDTNEAVGVTDEEPDLGPIEAPNGIWTHVIETWGEGYVIKRRDDPLVYIPDMLVEPISKSEYETYLAMGMFNDVDG